jgi:nucleoside-diphosphate-sugar epimerase
MRVFVTGASGWIGSAVVAELIGAGHQVIGLARSDDSAAALAGAGAEARRGTLDDLDVLAGAAAWGEGPRVRHATAEYVLSLAARGVRSSVVRLPPTNHGDGDGGFMATLVAIAREKGVSGYIGDGANRWPAVHRLDSAHLFQLALEHAPAGSTLHAVADEGVPIRDVAEVIGRHLNVPAASIAPQDAAEHFSWLAGFIGFDSPASSALTRELLAWQPTRPGLIDDLDQGHYFRDPAAGG